MAHTPGTECVHSVSITRSSDSGHSGRTFLGFLGPARLLLAVCCAVSPPCSASAQVSAGAPAPHAGGTQARADLLAFVPASALVVVELNDATRCHRALSQLVQPVLRRVPGAAGLAPAALAAWVELTAGIPLVELTRALAPGPVALVLLPPTAAAHATAEEGGGARRPLPLLLCAIPDPTAARECLAVLEARLDLTRRGVRWQLDALDGLDGRDARAARAAQEHLLALGAPAALAAWGQWRADRGVAFAARGGASATGRPELPHGGGVRWYADLTALRRLLPGAARPLWDRLDPAGRFLAGPLARALDASRHLHGVLRFARDDELDLVVRVDGSVVGDDVARPLLAAGGALRSAPPPPAGAAGFLSLDRSVLGFCRNAERLLPEAAATQLRSALATADTVLGRGSLVDDLLAGLREPATLFVLPGARPGFVLVAPLVGEGAKPVVHSGAYRLAAIASAERARTGKRPFLIRPVRREGLLLHVAAPLLGEEEHDPEVAGLSPTLTIAHGHLIVATTLEGALAAARALPQEQAVAVRGDCLRISCHAVADLLAARSEALAVDRVLNEGESLDAARSTLRGFVAVLRALDTIEASLVFHETGTELVAHARRRQR